jgi:hypothetical protein
MKIAPSKVLLVLGLGIYGYSLRKQFSEPMKVEGAALSASKELTGAVVNYAVALSVSRDPFTGALIKGGGDRRPLAMAKAPVKPLGPMVLQGVVVSEDLRSAIVNGKTLREGEAQPLEEGGPVVYAKTIGADFVVMRAGFQDVLLHLEKPTLGKEAQNTTTGTPVAASASANAPAKPEETKSGGADARMRPRYVSQEKK